MSHKNERNIANHGWKIRIKVKNSIYSCRNFFLPIIRFFHVLYPSTPPPFFIDNWMFATLCSQNCRAQCTTNANNSSLNAKTRGLISSVFRCLAFPKMAGGTTSFPSCYVLIIPLYLASLCLQSFVKLTSHFASNQPRTF